ncbi:MAG: mechanosensitive ion channel family protein [Actinobacteria bacterium]|nr:mechanosensitive ion channel family protein [Actinomycetota bacterium]
MLAFLEEGTWLRDSGVPILITLVVAMVATVVLRAGVRRFQRKLENAPSLTQAGNLQRAATLAHALSATIMVAVWTIAILIVLGYLNVNLAPLIASAGIAGVALGFGAQSIVRDGLSGFFILLENQFGVGDTVEVRTPANPVLGRIEWFTLRATSLRAYDGTLNIVPNGNITVVSNKSRGWARAIVDTPIAYQDDPELVREILDELFDELRSGGAMQDSVMDGPSVLGVETTSDTGVVIRSVAETRPSRKADVERLLRAKITQRLAERGIRAPASPAVAPPDVHA